jgi:hypothetical protein
MKKNLHFIFLLIIVLVFYSIAQGQVHLLLTEAVVTPTSDEFIEIYNPTGVPVDLTNYYLSDDEDYALYPGTFGAGPAPSITSSDFIVQFPPGAVINPGQVVVVAFDGALFLIAFGMLADYEIKGTDPVTPDMLPSNLGASAGLTNSGENACLFYWDGLSDLVLDVDMVNIGTPSSTNDIANKTGVAVDGPDADTLTTIYLPDAYTMPQQLSDPGFGFSTKRILLEGPHEINVGGNGLTGHDETSENILVTWDTLYVAPDPWVVGPGVPVELVSFSASVNGNSVKLSWITATELNNFGFEIQRAQVNSVFEKIGFVNGNGSTTEVQHYSYTDKNLQEGNYTYRLKQVDLDGSFEYSKVVEVELTTPIEFELSQNYPNPFNPVTAIRYSLPEAGDVKLNVYNLLGEQVAELVNEYKEAGVHTISFSAVGGSDSRGNALQLESGVYIYKLESNGFIQSRKMTLIK